MVNAVHSLERDLARAREIAERGLILRTTVGSVVHGLSNPGTDDRDEMGVCIEPPEYLLGFHRFEHFVYRTQPEGHPSGPGDLDLVVYGLRKFDPLEDAAAALEQACERADVPERSDVERVDAFVVGAYRRGGGGGPPPPPGGPPPPP